MSYFPSTQMDTVISFPRFVDLLDRAYNSVADVPRQYFLIQLRPGARRDAGEHATSTGGLTPVAAAAPFGGPADLTDDEIDDVISSMPPVVNGEINDIRDEFSGIESQGDTISLIFQVSAPPAVARSPPWH